MQQELICVLDVGKTLTKLSTWTQNGELIAKLTRPNVSKENNIDTESVIAWLKESLREISNQSAQFGTIKAILPVAHGAAWAAIKNNELALPIIDYEQEIPKLIEDEYNQKRDKFSKTGSPRLPNGLNFGAQIYYVKSAKQAALDGATIIPFAQYWAWILSGIAASEITSLGCHSDLWNPEAADFSDFAKREGFADKFAPLRKANEVLGPISEYWAKETGVAKNTLVYCGIHDSNAALIAARGFREIAQNEATILSTGTWFVAMRTPKSAFSPSSLSETRDCLINIDAFGNLIPSARFMGGREIESHIKIDTRRVDIAPDQPALLAAVEAIVTDEIMALPNFAKGYGPFTNHNGYWLNEPRNWFETRAAISLYAALVANTSLDLIGSKKNILVEGRFAKAEVFIRALASLRPNDTIYAANETNDVSFGALRLINPELMCKDELKRITPLDIDIKNYVELWQEKVREMEKSN